MGNNREKRLRRELKTLEGRLEHRPKDMEALRRQAIVKFEVLQIELDNSFQEFIRVSQETSALIQNAKNKKQWH